MERRATSQNRRALAMKKSPLSTQRLRNRATRFAKAATRGVLVRGVARSAGPQGPTDEVSAQQLTHAIANTAQNHSGIGPDGGGFSDPPTQGEMQDFAAYVETMRAALAR